MDAEQLYAATQKLIKKIANRYYRINGGEFDDWLGEANVGWVKAYNTWDASKAQFTTYCTHVVKNHLHRIAMIHFAKKRRAKVYNILCGRTGETHEFVPAQPEIFDLNQLQNEVSTDAWKAIQEALRINETILNKYSGRVFTEHGLVKRLRKRHWGVMRIQRAFDEVKEALET